MASAIQTMVLTEALTQMVEVLGLPKTTVHRLLKGLLSSGALTALTPKYGPYIPTRLFRLAG